MIKISTFILENAKMGQVTIFCDDSYVFKLDKDVQARLALLNCDVVFDMKLSELQFIFPGDSIILDFTEHLVVTLDSLSIEIYNESKNNVPEFYQEQIDILSSITNTDFFLYGEGYLQTLYIKIYDKYIVFTNISLDDDDGFDDDPDDPDDGEKIPNGDFLFYYKLLFFISSIILFLKSCSFSTVCSLVL